MPKVNAKMDIGATEMVEITLNKEGSVYIVVTDLQTAHILLNDPEAAEAYLQAAQTEQLETENGEEVKPDGENVATVWSSKKPTEEDLAATEYFLKLRNKLNDKFSDKKSLKSKLWLEIATKMEERGYALGASGSERCRQKFANLQKTYFAYVKHVKQTGSDKKEMPLFYDLIHSILGGKDKTNPEFLLDSEEPVTQGSAPEVRDEVQDTNLAVDPDEPSTSATPRLISGQVSGKKIVSRFARRNSLKPETPSNKVLASLKEELALDRQERQQQFQALQKELELQNAQRERFLDIFASMAKQKKRRRSSTDEDES